MTEGREPPLDIDAEQAVLGAVLLQPALLGDLELVADDFYRPAHVTIFGCIAAMFAAGQAVDAVTVAAELSDRKELERIGGAPYLHTLINMVPTVANGPHYAGIVADKARRRAMLAAGVRIQQLAHDEDADADTLMSLAVAAVAGAERTGGGGTPLALSGLLTAAMDQVEAASVQAAGLPLPWLDLNNLVAPLRGGQLIVVGARPGTGKSVVALDLALHAAADRGMPAIIFSLEMGADEVCLRALSSRGRVPLTAMITGQMTDDNWLHLAKGAAVVAEEALYVDDHSATIPAIRQVARRYVARHNVGLIVIDYLQLMATPAKAENRQAAVADMSRSLKLMAKELGVPVVALSQLNRALVGRGDKRPGLHDLRESGAIEQDADLVLLLHREDMYDRDSPRAGEMDIIVAKQRNGPTGTVPVAFQGTYVRCTDLARPWTGS